MKLYKIPGVSWGKLEPDVDDLEREGLIEVCDLGPGHDIRFVQDAMLPEGGQHTIYQDGAYVTAGLLIQIIQEEGLHPENHA